MNAVFRVDSGAHIGAGHLMRCLTLALALREKEIEICFVTRPFHGNFLGLLDDKNIPYLLLPEAVVDYKDAPPNSDLFWLGVTQQHDAHETINLLNSKDVDYLIVDQYGIDAQWERSLKPYTKNLVVIEDLPNRYHQCNLLLDQNLSKRGNFRYKALVPEDCTMLLGPRYALIRKEFADLRKVQAPRKGVLNKILIFFTAGNDYGETIKAMEGVEIFSKACNVDVVIGSGNADRDAIEELCQKNKWGYHCQIDYMATLISNADLVIGSAGSSSWERCALGAPSLISILADNQVSISEALNSAYAAVNLGWHFNLRAVDYAKAIQKLTPSTLLSLSKHSFSLVDAYGAHHVSDAMLSMRDN